MKKVRFSSDSNGNSNAVLSDKDGKGSISSETKTEPEGSPSQKKGRSSIHLKNQGREESNEGWNSEESDGQNKDTEWESDDNVYTDDN